MSENSSIEVIVGGAVLALALGFFLYAGHATGLGAGTTGHYDLTASFRSAEGVSVGTDVRMAGVKIGTVSSLDLNPQTFRADARFTVKDGIELPDDSTVMISTEGLLGGTFVEIVPGGSAFNLEPGDEMLDTQGAVSLVTLLLRFFAGSDDNGGT